MIPRYQRIVFWTLVAGILLMAGLLIRGCQRNHDRIVAARDQSPIAAPTDLASENLTIAIPSDADGSITLDQRSLALPEEPSLRARVLLDRLLDELALPASTHPIPAGPAVTDVFLLPLPITNTGPITSALTPLNSEQVSPYGRYHANGSQLAVVNLTRAFADAHPSGIESEDLTLRAIIATLHANFSSIDQVRFLVDGQSRDTLAGHADLTRPYAVTDPNRRIHILAPDGTVI